MIRKIIITGAEGFLGSHLANFLKLKDSVYCFVKKFPKKKIKNVNYFRCDVRNKSLIKKLIKEIKPNVIFHLAAKSHPLFSFKYPEKTILVNTLGTINILQSIVELNFTSKIIIACSSAQYGTRKFNELPLKESENYNPDHIYGLSKKIQYLLSNQFSKMFKLKVINAIIFNTSGPGKKNDVFYDFSKQFLRQQKKKTIKIKCGNIFNKRDFLHYKDTIRALDILSKKGKYGESYNISTGKLIKISELLQYISKKSKKKIEIISRRENLRIYDEKYISGNNNKIKKIGWKPKKDYKDILDEMCNFD